MSELLNCPWCGRKATLHKILFWWYVECDSWKCPVASSTELGKKEVVIEKWNTRAPIVQQRLSSGHSAEPNVR